ncbi:MAG: helix-turn-helix transcriptional regulator [Crocinitomicaceae bacterium]|nr:helix-turn-helix transcriptional regulator [Crocinitomicaceae bacterium]
MIASLLILLLNPSLMLLYLSLFTILISIFLLWNNWKSNKNIVFLVLMYILTSFFSIGHYYIVSGSSRFWLAVFYNNFAPFMFLIGPFIYFYVRNTLKDCYTKFKKDWVHFVPSTIALIGNVPYTFKPFEKKLQIADQIIKNLDAIKDIEVNLFYSMGESFALRTISVFIYLLYCFYLVWKFYPSKNNETQVPRQQFIITYRWIIILLNCMLFISISFIILGFNSINSKPSESIADGPVYYVIAGFSYCVMSLSLIIFPEVLYGIPRKRTTNPPKKEKEKIKIEPSKDPFYDLSKKIVSYLNTEKPYLKYDFTISDIALDLKVPQNHVAYCLNCLIGEKFSRLKTELRIKHAIELLEKGTNSILTIDAISEQSGFKSRSNFYAAFKEKTGVTPNEYIEKLRNN